MMNKGRRETKRKRKRRTVGDAVGPQNWVLKETKYANIRKRRL